LRELSFNFDLSSFCSLTKVSYSTTRLSSELFVGGYTFISNNKAMISVLSTTSKYILQPSLLEMHNASLACLSASALWKRELSFFQKLLDATSPRLVAESDKKLIDHFQSLVTYYDGEVVDNIRKKVRDHESHLAQTLQKEKESDTQYFQEHKSLMNEVEAFEKAFRELKHDLFAFVERIL